MTDQEQPTVEYDVRLTSKEICTVLVALHLSAERMDTTLRSSLAYLSGDACKELARRDWFTRAIVGGVEGRRG